MGDEESGGVRGLRVWAAEASERANELIGRLRDGTATAAEFEGPLAELTALRDLLDHDGALLAKITLGLGGLLALRFSAGLGTPEDRERGQRLLREVHDPATAAGAAAEEEDRSRAALLLLTLSAPVTPRGPAGPAADFWSVFDWAAQAGPGDGEALAADVTALAGEAETLPLPPEVRTALGQVRGVLSRMSDAGFDDPETLLALLPAGFPFREQVRMLLTAMAEQPGTPTPTPTARPAEPAPGPGEPAPRPGAPSAATDTGAPAGSHAVITALVGGSEALRSGDPEAVDHILRRLGAELDGLPDDHDRADEIRTVMRLVLQIGQPLGGSHQDGSLARGQLEAVAEYFARQTGVPPAAGLTVATRVLTLVAEARSARETESGEEIARAVAELESLERSTPADHPVRPIVLLGLGLALTELGTLTRDTEVLLRGLTHQETFMSGSYEGLPFVPEALLTALKDGLRATRAVVGQDPGRLPAHTPAPPEAAPDALCASGMTATLRYSATGDPADLDAAIGELERFRERIRQGLSPQLAADGLWLLAENLRTRSVRTGDPADRDAATDAALESLQALAADVVLQTGPDHGLLTARSGADRGVRAAVRAASEGRVEEAVAALELGRALVLQAASTSRAVPELLEERGHHELARAWRSANAHGEAGPGALPRELPSSLRRRALDALGRREPGGVLFRTPAVAELRAGLAESGADALLYLLAGEGGTPGTAILVGPGTDTRVQALPLLCGDHSGPLERYLDASAERQRRPGTATAEAWRQALSELCDWATDVVVTPVLAGLGERLAVGGERRRPGPPRIVLVPCGRLGIVPWHAARLPSGAPDEYLCQTMVISYAASGRQFLDAVRRTRRAPAADPVLVADATLSLDYAGPEVTALYRSCYPRARLYGDMYAPPVTPVAPGTPDEILDLLDGTPSLLHLACHASAGTSPTTSFLVLAHPDGRPGSGDRPGHDPDPDPDRLTVSRLLARPRTERGGTEGPLVVLSACETDLTTRDHDEALTLTTAFLAGGARDVVGSRWIAQDSDTALMMAVFHHCLSVEGRGPADALRAAQLWMLDPHRRAPGPIPPELLAELDRNQRLAHPAAWAAFIHQGHPGL
ncbi:CHAT domain-containing protein [Streptomyces naphthomycinicus]|uniref:CHAT domain-containing protein n=1 Tax=Streptomyces naphthomycinicus TaxID=2872625 RepID=UPI001CEC232E|nr:CHAT domain-containing protein [Streptomyces sp. TML10]